MREVGLQASPRNGESLGEETMALGTTFIPRHPRMPDTQGSFKPSLLLLEDVQVISPTVPVPSPESVIFSQPNSVCFSISNDLLLWLLPR